MSKRSRDAGGAFDALVHAIASYGAGSRWTDLPPPTAPGSLARALGQGVLQGRLPGSAGGTPCVGASPLPIQQLRHEGQRSVAELGAILWHAMGGARDAPELASWMAPPHTDPVVALALSRRRLAEYAAPEAMDRSCAFPGTRVWLIEIDRARGDVPAGIAVWRSRGADGEWRTRCACVWTHGRIGSTTHPLVIGAQWETDGGSASAGACVVGPSPDGAARAAKDASRNTVLARRQNAIGPQMMARIAVPAAFAWLDYHGGKAHPAGHFGEGDAARSGQQPRPVRPMPAVARTPPPRWLSADAERAVEAIVICTAREGWRIGASCPVQAWRSGWAGYAEMGAVAWHAIGDPKAQIDTDTWRAMEKALREDGLASRSVHPALAATSALVRKMLEQTERSHVARAPDDRPLCALEVPARLWRALGEAGPCPHSPPEPDLSERWWLVEIEDPTDDEPNAIALWEADGAEVALAAFVCADEGSRASFVTVVTWHTSAGGERSGAGLAALRGRIHVDNPHDAESRACTQHVIDTLAAPDTGPIARAKTAIAVHLASDGRAAPLSRYRASAGSTSERRRQVSAEQHSITALFALERAPEPVPAQDRSTGEGRRSGAGGRLRARHHVRAHWKRQAFGAKLARRRWIVVEGYVRGPVPGDDQIVVTRLAQRQRPARDTTRENP